MGSFWIAEGGGDSVLLQLITAKLAVLEEANCGDRYSCTTENACFCLRCLIFKKKKQHLGHEAQHSGGLRTNLDNLGLFNVHRNLDTTAPSYFAYLFPAITAWLSSVTACCNPP